ncbi:MAG: flagellar hook-length control protein FliK [Treponema sp.]|nr:flagellar hook-length control protein FliK [Treponema sp.]
MQAIADIILQSEQDFKTVQISQNSSIPQNSSNSPSFAEMLDSLKTESSSEEKPEEISKNPEKIEEKKSFDGESKKTDKVEEKVDVEDKTDTDEQLEKSEKIDSGKKIEVTEKSNEKALAETKTDKKSEKSPLLKDSKKNSSEKSVKKIKTEDIAKDNPIAEHLSRSFNRMNELTDQAAVKNEAEEAALLVEETPLAEKITENIQNNTDKLAFKDEKNTSEEKNVKFEDLIQSDLEEDLEATESKSKDNTFEAVKDSKNVKKQSENKISVTDLRSQKSNEEKSEKDSDVKVEIKKNSENFVLDKNEASVTMEIGSQNAESNMLSLNNQTAASNGSNYQAMLNNQIQANVPDIVKAGSIVLRDNDQGTINLVLHPDDLGNVKIHITMDGKSINGHITVNSKEALQVFKDNAETLREAFIKEGFDVASFDVAMNNGSSNQSGNFENLYDGNEFVAKRMYGAASASGEVASDLIDFEKIEEFSEYSINIVA